MFANIPNSKTIPAILRFSWPFIGDDATKTYLSRLNEEQSTDPEARLLKNYFSRKERVEAEKYFQDFTMTDASGKTVHFSALDKKIILIDFWSSDCMPCRRRHLTLAELYKKYAKQGLEIVSISLDTEEKEWKQAIVKDKMIWLNVSDLKGWSSPLAEHYFITYLPFAILVDRNKRIISTTDLNEKQIVGYLE